MPPVPAGGPPQNPLNGAAWEVAGFNTLTTRFSGDQVSGNSGCNEFSGKYWVSGGNIFVDALAAGMMFCAEPEGAMDQEAQFQAALRSATTFQLDGNRLTLRRGDGSIAVAYI